MAGILKVDQYQDFNGNNIMTSDGAGNLTLNNAALKMTPAFEVYLNSNQSISASTYTKVQYNTEILDTDSCYDNATNYRFTPTVSGYYYLEAQIMLVNSAADFQSFNIRITKNGSDISNIDRNFAGNYFDAGAGQGLNVSVISQANGSTDYFEVQGISSGTSSVFYGTTGTSFRGYRIGD